MLFAAFLPACLPAVQVGAGLLTLGHHSRALKFLEPLLVGAACLLLPAGSWPGDGMSLKIRVVKRSTSNSTCAHHRRSPLALLPYSPYITI